MAHPHPTPDVPGHWPHLLDEVARCALADSVSNALCDAIGSDDNEAVPGHVCATTWIFDPGADFTLLVRHRVFGWSAPGGHIEPHETSREGGLRELEEETGLTRFDVTAALNCPAMIHTTDLPGDRPHRHWNIAWLYIATLDTPVSPNEGARWWPVTSLPSGPPDLQETTRRLMDVVRTRSFG
jgi:8-oxo-dGTP pyrophosphatase MutT (NUDIX family)